MPVTPSYSTPRSEPRVVDDSPEARAYRRGFRQKNKRDDYALDLFHEARAKLVSDPARVGQILAEEGFGRLLRHPEPEASISPATAGRDTKLPRAKVIDFAAAYAPYYIAVIGPAAMAVKGKEDLADK